MNTCSDNDHGELVYEERNCPACARIAELEDEVNDLKKQVRELEAQI